MTISTTTVKQTYEGDGSTVVFAIPSTYFQASDIKVYLRDNSVDPVTETLLTNAVEYNLTDIVDGLATNVTMVAAPADNSGSVGEQLVVSRLLPLTQSNTPDEAAVEEGLDRNTMMSQQIDEEISRTVKLPISTTLSDIELPEGAGLFIKWNAAGDNLEVEEIDLSTLESDIASNTANIIINAGDITTVENSAADNSLLIDQNTSDIADVAALIAPIESEISNINSTINGMQVQIDELIANYGDLLAYVGITGSEAIANSQATPLTLANFVFDGDDYTSIIIEYEIRRFTDTNDLHSVGTLNLVYRNTSVWETERGLTTFDIDGVTFTIATSAGNIGSIQYISDNLAGTSYDGNIKFRIKKFEV